MISMYLAREGLTIIGNSRPRTTSSRVDASIDSTVTLSKPKLSNAKLVFSCFENAPEYRTRARKPAIDLASADCRWEERGRRRRGAEKNEKNTCCECTSLCRRGHPAPFRWRPFDPGGRGTDQAPGLRGNLSYCTQSQRAARGGFLPPLNRQRSTLIHTIRAATKHPAAPNTF
jgi:hypothetical protein